MCPDATPEKIAAHAKKEALSAWQLYTDGVIRELYFSDNPPAAVLILEATSVKEAGAVLAQLPLVALNLIEFDLRILHPFKQFETLFEQ